MNWIPFSERKPEAEPHRYVLIHWRADNRPAIHLANTDNVKDWPDDVTDWCEIDPPNNSPLTPYGHFAKWWRTHPQVPQGDCESQRQKAREAYEEGWSEHAKQSVLDKEPLPKPDPFEEWWKVGESMCDGRVPKIFAYTIWDAAIKYAKDQWVNVKPACEDAAIKWKEGQK